MTNPFKQFNREARFWERRGRNVSVAIQLPFFGKRFLAAARRSRAISKSSLPSQNSISSLAKAIRCSTWKLNGRRRRRHMASNSMRCSSDMRMLNWSVFFATPEACQTRILNSWVNMIDNGIHCYNKCRVNVSSKSQKTSGLNGDSWRKILLSDESGESSHAAGAKGEPTSKR
jgi:hypothetical protein